jgi:glycosyltransferase involved in cell wall biosynthesis
VHLRGALEEAGHEAEVLRIPFQWTPATRIPSQMLLVMGLELRNVDRVIALKFPAYLIQHPQKTLWLLHQYRQAYDLWDAGMTNLPKGPTGEEIRRLIINADDEAFRATRRVFVNSDVTRDRLAHYSKVRAEVLRPPLNDPELFTGGEPDGYVFAGGRINEMKRQHLLLEALALTPPNVRLVIAGPPDGPADGERLERLAESLGVADRVKLDLRFLPRAEVASYVNHATAVACLPYDEDSLSYVAMEGAAAGKPIITTDDSGGVLRLVDHLRTGFVAHADRESLADGLQRFGIDSPANVDAGMAARAAWTKLEITWPRAVERLLA